MRTHPVVLAAALFIAHPLASQSLAERVANAGDGAVVFTFAARPEVCGDGHRMTRIGTSYWTQFGGERGPCVHGPVQVRLTTDAGRVRVVESWVGAPRAREGRDLGAVSASEAAGYLLGVAASTGSSPGARAVTAAVFADSAVVWPSLVVLARERAAAHRSARREAMFWLSRFAGAAIAGHPATLGDDDTGADEVKLHAVFVMSQLRNGDGIDRLLELARSRAELGVRQRALFWIGQSGDPRAVTLFESLLRG